MYRLGLTGLGVAALLFAACGDDSSSSASTTAKAPTTAAGAAAAGAVNVQLGDTQGVNGPETLVLSAPTAKAGKVTFVVKNTGTIDHEMVALKTDTAFDQLTVTDDKVSEDTSVGETGDPALKPGETRTITLDMAAGKYALVCNIAKHYAKGMRAAFTVGS